MSTGSWRGPERRSKVGRTGAAADEVDPMIAIAETANAPIPSIATGFFIEPSRWCVVARPA
jgi:hypothetical protein